VNDVAQDVAQDVAKGLLGAAKDGRLEVLVVVPIVVF